MNSEILKNKINSIADFLGCNEEELQIETLSLIQEVLNDIVLEMEDMTWLWNDEDTIINLHRLKTKVQTKFWITL